MDPIQTLTERITKTLLFEIQEGRYQNFHRLPPEKDIALHIGVSRTVVREALGVLEREGFINRKHGIGTIVNQHILKIPNRMDLAQEFAEKVINCGYTPSRKLLASNQILANKELSEILDIPLQSPLIEVACLVYANNKPAIYCIDYFSKSLIQHHDYDDTCFNAPIFDFLKTYCNIDIHMDITEVRAIAADVTVAKLLDLPFATPVLFMGELGYTFLGSPVLYSKAYYADGIIQHTLLRKKI